MNMPVNRYMNESNPSLLSKLIDLPASASTTATATVEATVKEGVSLGHQDSLEGF